jgi:aminoglycoside phosphotransferase (APT) family kinase protein
MTPKESASATPVGDLSAHLPSERFGAIREVRPMAHGMSGASVYDVTTERGQYVLRIAQRSAAEQWSRQLETLRLASAAGIAPSIEWVNEDALALVSTRISGGNFISALGDPLQRPRVLASLVDTLATLHRLPGDGVLDADPVHEARGLWRQQSVKPGFPGWASHAPEQLDRCERHLLADSRRVLSHNDLNPTNVLWDGARVWLVDWEVSGLTHPYYDLAVLSMFLNLSEPDALALLARQEGVAITPQQAETFAALRRVASILCGTMFLSLAGELRSIVSASIEEVPTLAQLYAKLGKGELSLRSPSGQARFGEALLRQGLE